MACRLLLRQAMQPRLVFILGAPRSGTTWMWGLLTSHPDIIPITREDFDPANPSVVDGRRVTSETGAFVRYDDAMIERVIQTKLDAFPDKVLVEKTPYHTLHLARIRSLFPAAKFVYMLRDPRAVVSSVLHSTFFNFDRSIENATKQYRQFVETAAPYFDTPGFLKVRYEDLTVSPATGLHSVLEFLGLSPKAIPGMIAENRGKTKVDIAGVFRRGITDSYRDDLRQDQIEFIETDLADLLALHYPANPPKSSDNR
jgi:hypothetical protein